MEGGAGGTEEMGPAVGQGELDVWRGAGFLGPLAVFCGGRELRGPRRARGVEPLSLPPAGGASVEPPGRQESGRGSPLAMGGAGGSEHGGQRRPWRRCQGALAGSGACAGRAASGGPSPGAGGSPGPGSRGSALGAGRGRAAVGGRGSAVRAARARERIAEEQEAGGREHVSPRLKVFPGVQRMLGLEARGCLSARQGRRREACCRAAQSAAALGSSGRAAGSRPACLRHRGVPDLASRPLRGCRAPSYHFPFPHSLCLLTGVARVSEMVPELRAFPTLERSFRPPPHTR